MPGDAITIADSPSPRPGGQLMLAANCTGAGDRPHPPHDHAGPNINATRALLLASIEDVHHVLLVTGDRCPPRAGEDQALTPTARRAGGLFRPGGGEQRAPFVFRRAERQCPSLRGVRKAQRKELGASRLSHPAGIYGPAFENLRRPLRLSRHCGRHLSLVSHRTPSS
jgi:hypothetical protein